MSKAIYWQAAKPCTVKRPLIYRIRDWLRGGNPEPKPGRKVIHPTDDYGSWSQGFYPPALPQQKKPPVMRQHQPGGTAKNCDNSIAHLRRFCNGLRQAMPLLRRKT